MPQYLWSLEEIAAAVADHYSVPVQVLKQPRMRTPKVVQTRQVAQYLSRKLTYCSLWQIAHFYGQSQSGSVNYSWQRVSDQMGSNEAVKRAVDTIMSGLEAKASEEAKCTGTTG